MENTARRPAAFHTLAQKPEGRKKSSLGRYHLCCPLCQNSPWAGPAPKDVRLKLQPRAGLCCPKCCADEWHQQPEPRDEADEFGEGEGARDEDRGSWLTFGWRCGREAGCLCSSSHRGDWRMHRLLLSMQTCPGRRGWHHPQERALLPKCTAVERGCHPFLRHGETAAPWAPSRRDGLEDVQPRGWLV